MFMYFDKYFTTKYEESGVITPMNNNPITYATIISSGTS